MKTPKPPRTTIIMIITLLIPCLMHGQTADNMSRQQARETIGQVARQISGQAGSDKLQEITGQKIDISAWVADNTLNIAVGDTQMTPQTEEMARFLYASDRDKDICAKAELLASILDKAGYRVTYHYSNGPGNRSVSHTMDPAEMVRLKTEPIENLGFDTDALAKELIRQLNDMEKQSPADPDILSRNILIDGKYLTIQLTLTDPESMPNEHNDPAAARNLMLQMTINEMSSRPELFGKLTFTAEALGTKGMRFDLRDLTGRQSVFTVSWPEFRTTLEKSVQQSGLPAADATLDYLDTELNATFADEGLDLRQTHFIKDDCVTIILITPLSPDEFGTLDNLLNEHTLMNIYGETFQLLLSISEYSDFYILLYSGTDDEPCGIWNFSADDIKNHIPETDDGYST